MASDLRSFLAEIDDLLLRIRKPVAIDHVSPLIVDARQPILFEAIEGFPGWRVCDLLFRDRTAQARVLRTTPDRVLPELARRLALPPEPPRLVAGGPVKDRTLKGGDIDLAKLPGFQHGALDRGRTIIAMVVCRDPDDGKVNLSFTRIGLLSATRGTYLIGSSPHMRSILEKYERAKERMPIAFVVGGHPGYEIMASYSVPTHLERFGELEMVSALIGETVELVPCDTVPLEVPAHAEVVIEGYVLPGERADEGPGPSQFLYYHPGVTKQPVFEASAITMRDDPIFRQHNTLLYTDHQALLALPHEAILYDRLRELGLRVHDVQYVPWGGTLACVVKATPAYDGELKDALMFVLGQRWPNAKMAVAVDDDVDLESPTDLLWSIATRVDPERDVFIAPGMRGHAADPAARPIENAPRRVLIGKWGIDATKPPLNRVRERASFERALPPHWGEVTLARLLAT